MRLNDFKQSIFISEDSKNLAWISVADWDGCNEWHMSVYNGNNCVHPRTSYNYTSVAELMIPTVDSDTVMTVVLEAFKEKPAKFKIVVKPVKQHTIHLVNSAHEDLGYCGYANELGRGMYEYLLKAMNLVKNDPSYKYTIEHYWWLDAFDQYATDEEKAELHSYFKSGNIQLNAIHSGMHTPLSGQEELIRSTYYPRKTANKIWNISPKTAMFADISGISGSAISIFSGAGIKYAAICENGGIGYKGFRGSHDRVSPPLFFKWTSKNGDSLICWFQHGYGYAIPELDDLWIHPLDDFYFDESKARKTEKIINDYVCNLDVPYDIIPICRYHDREIPTDKLSIICKFMNKRWKFPQFVISNPDDFMTEVDTKYSDILPEFRGEWTDQWADFCSGASRLVGKKREAQEKLRTAEAVSVINAVRNSTDYPEDKLNSVIWKMCEFDEHCWASSAKNPQKMHIYNHKLMKEQNAINSLNYLSNEINKFIGKPDDNKISIWNFIPRDIKQSVKLDGFGIAEAKNQLLPDGHVITSPVSLNSYGSKQFTPQPDVLRGTAITDEIIDTGFYIIRCNHEGGSIESIIEKETGYEMLDQFSGCRLGEYIFVYDCNKDVNHDTDCNLIYDYAKPRKFMVEKGDVATVVTMISYEEQSGANVRLDVTFYNEKKEIDLHLSYENAISLVGSQYDRYKKGIFIGFPFGLDNFRFYTETATDIIDEQADRWHNAPNDFVIAHNWVTVEDNTHGYALYSKEMPLFHLGGIHMNELSSYTNHQSSHIYLYATSNRINQLEYRDKTDCNGEFHFSILPYEGHCYNKLHRWSEEQTYLPVVGKAVSDCRMINIDKDNVRFVAMKKAEADGGIIVRLYETSGTDTEFKLTLPFTVNKFAVTDIIENELTDYKYINSNTISLDVKAYSYLTLKLDVGANIKAEPLNTSPYVSEIFSFEVENTNTIICFKKHNCNDINRFAIYSGDRLLAEIPNDEYYVQVYEIDENNICDIRIEILSE